MGNRQLTPMQIHLMIHYHGSPDWCEYFPDTETLRDQHLKLESWGMLAQINEPPMKVKVELTPLGEAFVNQILRTPIPETEMVYRFDYPASEL